MLQIFNWVDYTIIGMLILSVVISMVRGFMREALSLTMWICAIWIGFHFYESLGQWLTTYIESKPIRTAAAFFILFFFTLLIGAFISFILVKFVHKTGLSGTDRCLGAVFGLARGTILVAIGLLIFSLVSPISEISQTDALKTSKLAPKFEPLIEWLKEFLPDSAKVEKAVKNAKLPEDVPNSVSDIDVPSLPV